MGLRALFSQPEPVFISAAARGCAVPALSPGGGSSLLLGTMSPDFCISSPSPAPQNPWGSQLRDVPVGTELLPLPYQGAQTLPSFQQTLLGSDGSPGLPPGPVGHEEAGLKDSGTVATTGGSEHPWALQVEKNSYRAPRVPGRWPGGCCTLGV